MIIINHYDEELTCYNKDFERKSIYGNRYEFFSFHWLISQNDWNIYSSFFKKKNAKKALAKDTVINGIAYKILQCKGPITKTFKDIMVQVIFIKMHCNILKIKIIGIIKKILIIITISHLN